jgi:hypothetical protein
MKKEDYDLALAYKKLEKKYNLSKYRELSQDFDIEKLDERESNYLLRDIRRVIIEKISAYMHLFEMLINPSSSPPLFIFSIIKKIDKDTREEVNNYYKTLSRFQIESMKLDTIYNENSEADFIKEVFNKWQEIKKAVYELIEKFSESSKENKEERKESYFG